MTASPTLQSISPEGLLAAMPVAALVVDPDGRIVTANERAAALWQRLAKDLLGRNLRDLYPDAIAQEWVDAELGSFQSPREERFYVPQADGGRVTVLITGQPLRDGAGGKVALRLLTFFDLTEQERVEADLQERFQDVARLSDTVLEQAMELKDSNKLLENKVRERTADLRTAHMDAILMLAVAAEAKDVDTGQHVRRIERYARELALAIGLSELEGEELGYSAILHDVGKIHVPDHILQKPGKLTEDERRVMQEHTIVGERILADKPFFATARQIARNHHENWDGSGYPDGLYGATIPLPARIVHLVDVYDAISNPRVYKEAWSAERACQHIGERSGTMFDPDLVKAFQQLLRSGKCRAE